MDIHDAKECARQRIRSRTMCGGCHWDQRCGIGQWANRGLAELLEVIDPSGLNITLVELGPIGGDK